MTRPNDKLEAERKPPTPPSPSHCQRGEGKPREAFQEKEALLVDARCSMFDELASRRGRRKTAKLVCGAKADRTRRRFGLHVVVTVVHNRMATTMDDCGMVRWPKHPKSSSSMPA